MLPKEVINENMNKAMCIQASYIEMMAAAYLKHTNLKPDEVELVQQNTNDGCKWFFRKKENEKDN